jgi:hypothetical protein
VNLIDDELSRAKQNSDGARQRLAQTMVALQMRLKPSALARDALEELKEVAGEMAQAGIASAKRNPVTTISAVAALGAFFARKPLFRLFRRKHDRP